MSATAADSFGALVTKALERDPRFHSDQFVYFVMADVSGLVKIGRAKEVMSRLKNLQIGNHESLTLLGLLAGGKELEREIHEMFAEQRIRGEWFRGNALMKALIFAAYDAATRYGKAA